MTLFSLIDNVPYLTALEPALLQTMHQTSSHHYFGANQIIFLEGALGGGLWIIERGQVKISKLNPDGLEYILHILGPTQSFNDIATLENGPNPATATALVESACWYIPTATIQHILDVSPAAAKAAIQLLTGRIRGLVHQLEGLALYSIRARLARYLLQQADDPTPGGAVTRVTIAAHLATTPESISRALRSLADTGAIRFDRHQILIEDSDLLTMIAQSEGT